MPTVYTHAPLPVIRAYIVGEDESTEYVCPTCHDTYHARYKGFEGWAVTTEDDLSIPYCEDCGAEIDGE